VIPIQTFFVPRLAAPATAIANGLIEHHMMPKCGPMLILTENYCNKKTIKLASAKDIVEGASTVKLLQHKLEQMYRYPYQLCMPI
jgi:hypothetical protein